MDPDGPAPTLTRASAGSSMISPPRHARRRGSGLPVLLCDLPFARLVGRFAFGAQARGRPRLEALQADLDAAALAVAVLVGIDARDGLVDLLDQLPLAVAVPKLERHVGLLARPVVRVGEHRRLVLHGVDRAVDFLGQLRLERLEDLAEVRALPRVHVLLALLGGIGREAFSGQFYGHWISGVLRPVLRPSPQMKSELCSRNAPLAASKLIARGMG